MPEDEREEIPTLDAPPRPEIGDEEAAIEEPDPIPEEERKRLAETPDDGD